MKFEKVYAPGGWNPAHKGHEEMLQKGGKFADNLDIAVGQKKKHQKYRLPFGVRAETVRAIAKNAGIGANIYILPESHKRSKIKKGDYDALLVGSDLAIILNRAKEESSFFSSFDNLIIVERPGNPVSGQVLEELERKFAGKVIVIKGEVEESAAAIRESYRQGGLDSMKNKVSDDVLEIIKDHAEVFKNEKND